MKDFFSTVVIGGGAAGFFAALAAKEANPKQRVLLLEKNAALLSKVKVSGGGRCNVTHACFDPKILVQNYPRGFKELLGPFHQFQPKDTIAWFEKRGVELKTESDGRMFPITDSSKTIIDCFLKEATSLGVEIRTKQKILEIEKIGNLFVIKINDDQQISASKLIVATGSATWGYELAKQFGHHIENPVPSLFTFNCPSSPISSLSGVAVQSARVQINQTSFSQTGPLLITHFGFSGPSILKLSAWAARHLYEKEYDFEITVNWLSNLSENEAFSKITALKRSSPSKTLLSQNLFQLPKNLWKSFLMRLNINEQTRLNDLSQKEIKDLTYLLCSDHFKIKGKTTHKEEFVTCGGVTLKEVNFKTMESKLCEGLFFAGEILDIDGVTGGFNFQNAWTSGFIAGSS